MYTVYVFSLQISVSLCQPWMKFSISFLGISQPDEGRHKATVTRLLDQESSIHP